MKNNIATKRYAKALFNIAEGLGENSSQRIAQDLGLLRGCLDASAELVEFFNSPIFSVEEKQKVIASLVSLGGIEKTVKDFCLLLAEKGRLSCLGDIVDAYQAMLDQLAGIMRSELVTAVELPAGRQEEIKSKLEAQAGKKLAMTFTVDPSIIGGVILKIGDKALDGSLRAQINILRENIKRGE